MFCLLMTCTVSLETLEALLPLCNQANSVTNVGGSVQENVRWRPKFGTLLRIISRITGVIFGVCIANVRLRILNRISLNS
jgi:hypothetical protein